MQHGNSWWVVLYRKVNQWVRRQAWKLRPKYYALLLHSTDDDGALSPDLLWKLGKGSLIDLQKP